MPALEPLPGLRVVAAPEAIDRAVWHDALRDLTTTFLGPAIVLRLAPDEAFAIGSTSVDIDDPDAIVESETGFVGAWIAGPSSLAAHIDWAASLERGRLQQGKVAGVPAKVLWFHPRDLPSQHLRALQLLLVTQAAHADELEGRLGW